MKEKTLPARAAVWAAIAALLALAAALAAAPCALAAESPPEGTYGLNGLSGSASDERSALRLFVQGPLANPTTMKIVDKNAGAYPSWAQITFEKANDNGDYYIRSGDWYLERCDVIDDWKDEYGGRYGAQWHYGRYKEPDGTPYPQNYLIWNVETYSGGAADAGGYRIMSRSPATNELDSFLSFWPGMSPYDIVGSDRNRLYLHWAEFGITSYFPGDPLPWHTDYYNHVIATRWYLNVPAYFHTQRFYVYDQLNGEWASRHGNSMAFSDKNAGVGIGDTDNIFKAYLDGAGNGIMAPMRYRTGDFSGLGIDVPGIAGYTFLGWYDGTGQNAGMMWDANNSGTWGGSWPLAVKSDYWPRYRVHHYKVRFNANGGSGYMADQQFTYDVVKNLSPNRYTRTGYDFQGWNMMRGITRPTLCQLGDGASIEYNLTAEDNATIDAWAIWKPHTLTVRYHYDDDAGTVETVTCDYDKAFGAIRGYGTGSTYRTYFDATGTWSVGSRDSDRTVQSGQRYSSAQDAARALGTSIDNGNATVDLYAGWQRRSHKVYYYHDGELMPNETQTIYEGLVHRISSETTDHAARANCDFNRTWYTDAACTKRYAEGRVIGDRSSNFSLYSYNTCTLTYALSDSGLPATAGTAIWSRSLDDAPVNLAAATGPPAAVTVRYGTKVTLAGLEYDRPWYRDGDHPYRIIAKDGWYTSRNGGGTSHATYTMRGHTTLYKLFEEGYYEGVSTM